MDNTTSILTVKDVADILRCSRAHVHNAIHGKVQGLPKIEPSDNEAEDAGPARLAGAVARV